uniref:RxLR effector candidate protein n=1 Tax=Hyaloperonospora arabidopsidis (strain Emoy2) TaxID=559515 RepID=M4B7R2_HYAAE
MCLPSDERTWAPKTSSQNNLIVSFLLLWTLSTTQCEGVRTNRAGLWLLTHHKVGTTRFSCNSARSEDTEVRFSGGDELLEGFGSVVGAMVDATGARTEDCGVVDMVCPARFASQLGREQLWKKNVGEWMVITRAPSRAGWGGIGQSRVPFCTRRDGTQDTAGRDH